MIDCIKNLDDPKIRSLRLWLYRKLGMSAGKNIKISSGVTIDEPHNLILGNDVSIQHNCYLSAYGKLVIGNDVSIGHSTSIVTSTHQYVDKELPIRNQPLEAAMVCIEDNVWIGMKCSILYGVTVESGAIIGANSLVNKNVLSDTIIAGIPAKFIKNRL